MAICKHGWDEGPSFREKCLECEQERDEMIDNQELDQCLNCKFGYSPEWAYTWVCRRYPPAHYPQNMVGVGLFPSVIPTYWCGEYIRKENTHD